MRRILILEDSPTQAQALRLVLQSGGFDAIVARDGLEGLALLEHDSFDLVISDIMMPGLSGYEVCQRIKSSEKLSDVPVVLLTSLTSPWDIVAGLECGADNFITKPYEPDHLLGRVRTILVNKSFRGERRLNIGINLLLLGKPVTINSEKQQILDLLISTTEEFLQSKRREEDNQRVQAVLLESQQSLQATLNALSASIAVLDRSGTIVAVNTAWDRNGLPAQLFGSPCPIGANYQEVCNLATSDCRHAMIAVGKAVNGILSQNACQWETEVLFGQGSDQRSIHIQVRRIEGSGTAAVVVAHEDISQRKRAEESLRRSEEQLRHAQKMEAIGRLAGGVAHDFNNMLCVVSGYAQLLRDDLAPGHRMYAAVQAMNEACDRAAALTKQLLLFSRKQATKPQVFDLKHVVVQVETMLRRLIAKNIELKIIYGSAPATIRADIGQVEQVIMNLAVNARDAMPDGGQIVIQVGNLGPDETASGSGRSTARRVILSVSDTGCGMDEATREHIFEPFFTTKPAGQGTGLGLATVFGIVEQWGGHITVETELNRGTTFHIEWPGAEPEPTLNIEIDASLVSVPNGRETIILAEDEAGVRQMISSVLRRNGYQVLEASDGEHALQLARQYEGSIDLLVSDLMMPGIGGRELADEVMRLRPTTKIIFCSGYDPDSSDQRSVTDSKIKLLQKPLNVSDLLRTVRALVDSKSSPSTIPFQLSSAPLEPVQLQN